MSSEPAKTTIVYDGSCPLCRAEISHYRVQKGAEALAFEDVSQTAPSACDLTQSAAMARFHVRLADGRLLSGAEAFVAVWRGLPRWRWAANLADLPGVLPVLELLYRGFLPVRPYLSRAFAIFATPPGTR